MIAGLKEVREVQGKNIYCEFGKYLDYSNREICHPTVPSGKLGYPDHPFFGRVAITEEDCKKIGNYVIPNMNQCRKRCPSNEYPDKIERTCKTSCLP